MSVFISLSLFSHFAVSFMVPSLPKDLIFAYCFVILISNFSFSISVKYIQFSSPGFLPKFPPQPTISWLSEISALVES